jgi:hypothetical protein
VEPLFVKGLAMYVAKNVICRSNPDCFKKVFIANFQQKKSSNGF